MANTLNIFFIFFNTIFVLKKEFFFFCDVNHLLKIALDVFPYLNKKIFLRPFVTFAG